MDIVNGEEAQRAIVNGGTTLYLVLLGHVHGRLDSYPVLDNGHSVSWSELF